MAMVEYNRFRSRFAGHEQPEFFTSLDWDADNDAEMAVASTMTVDEIHTVFHDAVGDSCQRVQNASLDDLSVKAGYGTDEKWNLRWIMIHMIEELLPSMRARRSHQRKHRRRRLRLTEAEAAVP